MEQGVTQAAKEKRQRKVSQQWVNKILGIEEHHFQPTSFASRETEAQRALRRDLSMVVIWLLRLNMGVEATNRGPALIL